MKLLKIITLILLTLILADSISAQKSINNFLGKATALTNATTSFDSFIRNNYSEKKRNKKVY
jgi:hypothetical protein